MPTQTVTVVALPNGTSHDASLARLSLYLSPRLAGGARIADFPDFVNWPDTLKAGGVAATIVCGALDTTLSIDVSSLRSDLWASIFPSDARVDPYTIGDYHDRLIVSYGVLDALASIKNLYQVVGAVSRDRSAPVARRLLPQAIRSFALPRLDGSLNDLLTGVRAREWHRQRSEDGQRTRPSDSEIDGVPTSAELLSTAQTLETSERFALFHSMPPAPNRPDLPSTPAALAELVDFHAALTAVTAYPSLMRLLGLVLDLELPLERVPESPPLTVGVRALEPGAPFAIAPTLSLPLTAYERRPDEFTIASDRNIAGGLLAIDAGGYGLVQVDVDGAMFKTMGLANALALHEDEGGRSPRQPSADTLPALRSAGLSLIATGRARELFDRLQHNKLLNDAIEAGTASAKPLTWADVVRGYRLDVWSSRSGHWHSLHRRHSAYRFGDAGSPRFEVDDEEGFTQLAITHAAADPTRAPSREAPGLPPSDTDIYLHERVANWTGWSLSAPRPGLPLNRSADPAEASTEDATVGEPATPFKLAAAFSAQPGSLPQLRFGTRYRLRARAVDLAGNSIPLDKDGTDGSALPADPHGMPYLRWEPVPAPLVVLREPPTDRGTTLDRLVIRTFNSDPTLDGVATAAVSDRHIAPARCTVRLAEHHGMLDDSARKLDSSADMYSLITTKDEGKIPTVTIDDSAKTEVPQESSPQLVLPYLPDPFAGTAALRGLPGAPDGTIGRIAGGALAYAAEPNAFARRMSVTHISFGRDWPSRSPFRLALAEGGEQPAWDDVARELRVFLPKSDVAEVELSAALGAGDLEIMGVWLWQRQFGDALHREAVAASSDEGDRALRLASIAQDLGEAAQLALDGGHWMLTPSRPLTLVHAVQQPLGRPDFMSLPVLGPRPVPDRLEPEPTPTFRTLAAWRAPRSPDAYLLGGLRVHGASTAKIDLEARWSEPVDDPAQPLPHVLSGAAHVDELPLEDLAQLFLAAAGSGGRFVGRYLREDDVIWLANEGERLGELESAVLAAPRHRFPDTKHRVVRYRAIATSRFRDCFPDDGSLKFTRSSDEREVDVPSSARPAAPRVLYVVPTFGWERQLDTSIQTSVRRGRGLRLYLERPWYSSGAAELLGVTCWHGETPPTAEEREANKGYVTQWGLDPIWQTTGIAPMPSVWHFPDRSADAHSLSLEETALEVDVAGHEVAFDEHRRLWYCDLTVNEPQAYAPFVRLALARYQPHSIRGAELSRVVLADIAQIVPDRSVVVTSDPFDPRRLSVTVAGVAPQGPTLSVVDVEIEQRRSDIIGDLAWEDAPQRVAKVERVDPDQRSGAVLWSGTVTFATDPPRGKFRLVIAEAERIEKDDQPRRASEHDAARPLGHRLVYLETIEINPTTRRSYPPLLQDTRSSLLAGGVEADALNNLLAGLPPTAPPALPLLGSQEMPPALVELDTVRPGDLPAFSAALASLGGLLLAGGVSAHTLSDLLAGLAPTAPPALPLHGAREDLQFEVGID